MKNTTDIRNIFIKKLKNNDVRELYNGTVKTLEIQNAHFVCDKDWIVREPNYDYASREIEWYNTQSLYVEDIPGNTPKIWNDCADSDGKINSNYGWCIFSNENGNQYKNCIRTLMNDNFSRQAVMIYNRPSMYSDANKNGMHDFMCTFCTQMFLNKLNDNTFSLKYIVYQRSCDAVFGFNNDHLWHKYVALKLVDDLNSRVINVTKLDPIEFNVGSLHVYERHWKFLSTTE